MTTRAIDLWVNATMGRQQQPEFMVRVKEDYFHAGADFFKNLEPAEMLEIMDRAGVTKAVVTTPAESPSPEVLAFPEAYPERFALAAHLEGPHYRNMLATLGAHGLQGAEVAKYRVDAHCPVYDEQGKARADFF